MKRQTYMLSLIDAGDAVPAECRLRRLLKASLRQYGFRCTSVRLASDAHQNAPERSEGSSLTQNTAGAANVPEREPLAT